jgi:DeoR/GlpR family transcriptional regulator of sugar metabolism
MLKRQEKILEALAVQGEVSVTELSKKLGVSEVTIRADLKRLEKEGRVLRTHGKAQLLEERIKHEVNFQQRKAQNYEKKNLIGKAAAELIVPGEIVLIDSSTTALAMARALRQRKDIEDITVIPTGIWGAVELMNCAHINVLMPCGYLRSVSGSITGAPVTDFFESINITKAFLGAWGISLKNGLMDSHLLEVELKKQVIKNAEEVYILADGSKFNQKGLATYSRFEKVTKIITDSSAPKKVVQQLKKMKIKIEIVK